MSNLVLSRFYNNAKNRPNDVYLTQPLSGGRVRDYTFSEVLSESRRMANYLLSLDLPRQSKIAIISKNCAHFIMSDLAIWMAGHVSVALYPTLTADTVEYILQHSEAKLLFVGKLDGFDEIKKGIPDGLDCVAYPLAPPNDYKKWDDAISDHEPTAPLHEPDGDDESLIIYTSGSTGKPKGVLHTFKTISEPTTGLVRDLKINPSDRMLSYLPLAHAMDRWLSECVSLYVGCRLYFAESVNTFVNDLKRARPTLFVSVPRLWLKFQLGVFAKMPEKKVALLTKIPIVGKLIKKKILTGLGLDEVRFAGSGSAPIPAELITWYRDLGLELLEGYGMSENFNYSHLTRPGQGLPGFIGHAHPSVDCKISDDGEILIKSPGNMVGYYKQPELTKDAFTEDGYLKTGDRGEIDSDGRLKITGRVKELFKTSKGKYVAPVPIENMINANSNVELSLVAGSGQPATHAVLQLSEELLPKLREQNVKDRVSKDLEKLLHDVNAKLPNFEQLQFLVVAKNRWSIEAGHLTPTMKIRRSTIESEYEKQLDSWYSEKKPLIWQD